MENQPERESPEADPFKVFISYRREDSAADARLVYERLIQRFGRENVFLDVVALEPGTKWLETIKAQGSTCGAFLAMIGPRWHSILRERAEAQFGSPAEDVVKLEIELALRRGSGVTVIPVLVGGATMPPEDALPRSLRPISATHAIELRYDRFDADVEALVETLSEFGRSQAEEPPTGVVEPDNGGVSPSPSPAPAPPPTQASSQDGSAMAPDERHYEAVVRFMADQGTLVPLLGSRVTGTLPDAELIAADLARRFGLEAGPHDLPRVAQQVLVSSGRPDLVRNLRQILADEPEPTALHRFLARVPAESERLGLRPQYQLILTTNYDTTLERAFDEQNEPYDLALYIAAGEDRGRFLHVPFDRDPEAVAVPNRYGGFPIDEFGELTRTVIVKIHGGVEPKAARYGGKDNFVITEDHYIDYLSAGPIESLIPVQILGKLTESHCLFLGYTMRDWYLRVFLNRIWRGQPLSSKSWAIARDASALEKDFWSQFGVEFFAVDLDDYVEQLQRQLVARGVPT
jgi:hypothetical protein